MVSWYVVIGYWQKSSSSAKYLLQYVCFNDFKALFSLNIKIGLLLNGCKHIECDITYVST